MSKITSDHNHEPWQRLRGKERCAVCDHQGYCRYTSTTIECMFQPLGARHTYTNSEGKPCYLHERNGQYAPPPVQPKREKRPNWTAPDQARCTALYNDLLANLTIPVPAAALAADARRFGEYAAAVTAVEDAVYFRPPVEVLGWLMEHGRWQDALAAGAIHEGEEGEGAKLAGALIGTKVYVYREHGQVRNLKGRKLDPSAKVKALSLHGTRKERGCEHILYQHDQLARAAGKLLVLAGGPAKVDACLVAGLHAVGGEESLSDAQIAAIAEADPAGIVVLADGEDPKTPGDLSPGQRHALAMGERLEALGGQAVRIAEPTRDLGSPKIDADNLLRDRGPEALRALVQAAVPLAVYRQRLGQTNDTGDDQTTLIATLRADVARLGDQLRVRDAELAEVREERDFYRSCLDCPDPVVGRAMPVIAEELHRAYRAGSPVVRDGQEFARLNFEEAAEGKTINRGAIRTAADRLGPTTPLLPIDAKYNRNGRDMATKHYYVACPVEERTSVARLGLGLLTRAAPQTRHQGRKPPKMMPAAVAAQDAPVRREQLHVEKFYSLRDDTPQASPLATQTTIGTADYWTPEGEQITQDAARAWQVAHGVRAAAVETQHHTGAPLRRFVGERPPASPTVEFQQKTTNVNSVETQQWSLPLDTPGQCADLDCGDRAVIGGYCEPHYDQYSHRYDRAYADAFADAVEIQQPTPPIPAPPPFRSEIIDTPSGQIERLWL